MAESKTLAEILLSARRLCALDGVASARLFRNNVGMAWAGKATQARREMTVRLSPGDVVVRNARPLHAGLCEGSSDGIGWTEIEITPDMVGGSVAVFTAVEAKSGSGRASAAQKKFLNVVGSAGGIACLARSADEYAQAVSRFIKIIKKSPPERG